SEACTGRPAPTVMVPLPWLVNRLKVVGAARPGATDKAPPLVKFTNEAGPVTVTAELAAVVTPLRAVPPVTATVPGPRTKPPITAAPLSVRVAPPPTARVPKLRLNVRDEVAVAVYWTVPAPPTVI